jgi:hypothetical protein
VCVRVCACMRARVCVCCVVVCVVCREMMYVRCVMLGLLARQCPQAVEVSSADTVQCPSTNLMVQCSVLSALSNCLAAHNNEPDGSSARHCSLSSLASILSLPASSQLSRVHFDSTGTAYSWAPQGVKDKPCVCSPPTSDFAGGRGIRIKDKQGVFLVLIISTRV